MKTWYDPTQTKSYKKPSINLTSLFSWLAVLMVIVFFWAAVAVGYERDYVPHAIARIEHKEKKFLATHKTIQKKLGGIHSLV